MLKPSLRWVSCLGLGYLLTLLRASQLPERREWKPGTEVPALAILAWLYQDACFSHFEAQSQNPSNGNDNLSKAMKRIWSTCFKIYKLLSYKLFGLFFHTTISSASCKTGNGTTWDSGESPQSDAPQEVFSRKKKYYYSLQLPAWVPCTMMKGSQRDVVTGTEGMIYANGMAQSLGIILETYHL